MVSRAGFRVCGGVRQYLGGTGLAGLRWGRGGLSEERLLGRKCSSGEWGAAVCPPRGYSTADTSRCPGCGHDVRSFKCSACGFLAPPPAGVSLFAVLGQAESYDLPEANLKKVYRQLQSEFHPDKYAQSAAAEREKSEAISSLINKAYFTLTNPYERGLHLLKLNNFAVNEEDTQQESAFLMEIMESNEELEAISTKEQLSEFELSNEAKIIKWVDLASDAFRAKDFEAAKSYLAKMKYFLSIRHRLKQIERSM